MTEDANFSSDINAYILGGGYSRRFGSPKCRASFEGRTLAERSYTLLQTIFSDVYFVIKDEEHGDYPAVRDLYPVQCAMNGITTALEHAAGAFVFITACDMPFLTEQTVRRICAESLKSGVSCFPVLDGRPNFTVGCYSPFLLPDLKRSMQREHYALHRFMAEHQHTLLDDIPASELRNVNRPEDLRAPAVQ